MVAGDARSAGKPLGWGQQTKCSKGWVPGGWDGSGDPGVCKGNSGIQNLQRRIKGLAGEEAGWVCVCITVVLPKSPQGQWEVESEVRQC